MSMTGKRAIVTGASGGLGSAITRELRAQGASVIGLDLKAMEGEIPVLAADVSKLEDVTAAVGQALERLGGLDILVNNAGINGLEDPGEPPNAVSNRKLAVNFFGTWNVTAAALPALLESKGRVINVASLGAYAILPFLPSYSASKRAISAYSDVLRARYGDQIKVTTVYPSYMKTAIHNDEEDQGFWPDRVYATRLGRFTLFTWEESTAAAARGIVRLCSGRAPRDAGVTWRSAIALFGAKHWPALVEFTVRDRIRRMEKAGMKVKLGLSSQPPDA